MVDVLEQSARLIQVDSSCHWEFGNSLRKCQVLLSQQVDELSGDVSITREGRQKVISESSNRPTRGCGGTSMRS
jgi:ABC-type amino acid transport substrate-binding protein